MRLYHFNTAVEKWFTFQTKIFIYQFFTEFNLETNKIMFNEMLQYATLSKPRLQIWK